MVLKLTKLYFHEAKNDTHTHTHTSTHKKAHVANIPSVIYLKTCILKQMATKTTVNDYKYGKANTHDKFNTQTEKFQQNSSYYVSLTNDFHVSEKSNSSAE